MRYSSESSAGCVCDAGDLCALEIVAGVAVVVFRLTDLRSVEFVVFGVPFNWELASGVRDAEAFACVLAFFVRIALSLS